MEENVYETPIGYSSYSGKQIYEIARGWHHKYPDGAQVEVESLDELAHLLGRSKGSTYRYLRGYPAGRLFVLNSTKLEEKPVIEKLYADNVPLAISVIEKTIEHVAENDNELLKMLDFLKTPNLNPMFKFDKEGLIELLIAQKNTTIEKLDDAIYCLKYGWATDSIVEIFKHKNHQIVEKTGVPFTTVHNWRNQFKRGILSIKNQNNIIALFNS